MRGTAQPAPASLTAICPTGEHTILATFLNKKDAEPVLSSGLVFCVSCGVSIPLDAEQREALEIWRDSPDVTSGPA